MRCPHCGAENADDARRCAACDEELSVGPSDLGVEEPLVESPRPRGRHAAPRVEEDATTEVVEQAEEAAPADQAKRSEEDEPVDQANQADESAHDERPEESEPAESVEQAAQTEDLEEADPAPAQTVVRPRIDVEALPHPDDKPEEHLVVRNTRDYDHDAQSVNTVHGTENLETIRTEKASSRDERRDPYARSKRRDTVPGEGNSRSRRRPLLAVLLVLAVLAGGAAVLSFGMELWGGKSVPSLVGLSQANAELALSNKGLAVRTKSEPSDDAIGKVLSQSPEVGTRVPEGSTVTIVVAASRVVPEVMGLNEEDARTALEDAGAKEITVMTRPSGEAEGTVIAVSPEQGETFLSRNPVILTLAGPYRVPDVVGKKESDAVEMLKQAGLAADVTYVSSDATVRTVVETSPAADEIVEEGATVSVKVSSPYPTSTLHLAEFFGHSSQDVDAYLQKEGYEFRDGFIDALGNAIALYASGEKGDITFSSQPYLRSLKLPEEGSSNVLSTGAPIAGVRWVVPGSLMPGQQDLAAAEGLAGTCGLEGMSDSCDETNITLPSGTGRISATFSCASGETGDLAWTVLVVKDGSTISASVTCAKKDLYSASDLEPFGGRLCQFVAYQEVYRSGAYRVKESKNDKKNDSAQGAAGEMDSGA